MSGRRFVIAAAGLWLACAPARRGAPEPEPTSRVSSVERVRDAPTGVTLLSPAGAFAPSLLALDGELSANPLRDVETCETCHPAVARQWRSSAHSLSSLSNPIYLASIDRFREANGAEASRFCGGCHDPALLVDGEMDHELPVDDPRAHAGVSCRTCHSMTHATVDGNGSYTLTRAGVEQPDTKDPASVAAHVARVAGPTLGTVQMCGSCHRAFLGPQTGHPHFLAGTDDVAPWMRSGFGGGSVRIDEGVEPTACTGCHMPREGGRDDLAADGEGMVASHRFTGGHTWLAAMKGDAEQLQRARELLAGSVSVDVARAGLGEDGAMSATVVVRNLSVGHRFPGGTRDAHGTWLDVRVLDADGELVARTDRDDAHVFRVYVADEAGRIASGREVESFRAPVVDHTIAPRDAVAVRYAFDVADDAVRPLTIEARVQHRSRTDVLRELTCAAGMQPRGRRVGRAASRYLGVDLDPCAEQPITEVAQVSVIVPDEPGRPARVDVPAFRRDYDLGLALLHEVQEHARDAEDALTSALAQLPADAPDRRRAMITAALAEVAIRQGRFDHALQLADRVEALAPDHPSSAMLRGRTHAAAWRWESAALALEPIAERLPGNDVVQGLLARAWASHGDGRRALQAAARGLSVAPRDPTLLRAQAIAAELLGAPDGELAWQTYDEHRPPDDAPHLASTCATNDPACALERLPIHVHRLR